MSNIAIIGLEDDTQLWVVDFAAGTVVPLSTTPTGDLATADAWRQNRTVIVKGIDLAIALSSLDDIPHGLHDD